jgi:hypothetical protein
MPRLSDEVRSHLTKARESALLAVETYNRPGASFRSGGFIVLMCIAWTAMFHAIFFQRKIKPFYRKQSHRRHFELVDGDRKAWELTTCLQEFWGANNPPAKTNMLFFIGLRNKIEHRSMPSLDISIFGECQALLFNFEDVLVSQFGEKYALNESLSLALQFSRIRSERQDRSIRSLHTSLARNISSYVNAFRSSLSTRVLNDPRFSYKVFLIPKPANRQSSADTSVEWVKFDPLQPDEMDRYDRIVSLIKPSATPTLQAAAGISKNVRVVDRSDALAVALIDPNKSHPYVQKTLLKHINDRLNLSKPNLINSYDLLAVRRSLDVESKPNFFYKGIFGPSQYSDAFADWIIQSYVDDNQFFTNARIAYKATTITDRKQS